jgi:hypothetical protein
MPKPPEYPSYPEYPPFPPYKPEEPKPEEAPPPEIPEEPLENELPDLDDLFGEGEPEEIQSEPEDEKPEEASPPETPEEPEKTQVDSGEEPGGNEIPGLDDLFDEEDEAFDEDLAGEPEAVTPKTPQSPEELPQAMPSPPPPPEPKIIPLPPPPTEKGSEVQNIVNLLKCLKDLTNELPDKEKTNFNQGKFPTHLESVIDSLKNLDIIKETTGDSFGKGPAKSQDRFGDVDGRKS